MGTPGTDWRLVLTGCGAGVEEMLIAVRDARCKASILASEKAISS